MAPVISNLGISFILFFTHLRKQRYLAKFCQHNFCSDVIIEKGIMIENYILVFGTLYLIGCKTAIISSVYVFITFKKTDGKLNNVLIMTIVYV